MSTTRLMLCSSSKFGFSVGTCQGFESYLKSRCNYQPSFIIRHGLVPFGIDNRKTQTKINAKKILCNSVESGVSTSPGGSSNSWYKKSWIVVMLLSTVLSFLKHKWGPLLAIKKKVDTVVETVECAVEVVEKVAEEVEKVADEVADALPENGKLKVAVGFIETIAKETAKDARIAEELIQKVENVEKEVIEVIEPLIEPVKDQVDKLVENHDNKDT